MSTLLDIIEPLNHHDGYWARRAAAQYTYASELSKVEGGAFDAAIAKGAQALAARSVQDGAVTKEAAIEAETALAGALGGAAKRLSIVCAAHAHIDMNWMWGYPETAAVSLDTIRTMLALMEEYPEFKFSQSQASVYRIVEQYDPDMLEEIRRRVQEGRWEVTASTWVEADKNMPNGESFARHVLYTKRYLSNLLGLCPDSLKIDFEPDTFGHSRNIPEVLTEGGVKYYYHCRGLNGPNVYRWRAPSGAEVLAYKDQQGYNAAIDGQFAFSAPKFCAETGLTTTLKVYGVGDHGGGPTRRDLERIIDMNTWPAFPNIRFGTFAEFFEIAESVREKLPLIDREMNAVFTGCYTTQNRIKTANRLGEARLRDSEAFTAFAAARAGARYPAESFEQSWRRVLFGQFHDIITGSGVIETREYAMGQFQETIAAANAAQTQALRAIAARIDTSTLPGEESISSDEDYSEGAGTGFGVSDYALPQVERGRGRDRILHIFNPTAQERREPAEVTLWDWPGDLNRLTVKDAGGRVIKHQFIGGKAQQLHPEGAFWGHRYVKLLIDADVLPFGYATYTIGEGPKNAVDYGFPDFPRVEPPDCYALENEKIRVELDVKNAAITAWIDKETGAQLVDPCRPAGIFRLIEEDTEKGMTSWTIGRYMNIEPLTENVKILSAEMTPGALRQSVRYVIRFRDSELTVNVSLDKGAEGLRFDAACDWHERPVKGVKMPQLNFFMPFNASCASYRYDVPFGVLERPEVDMDQPGNSLISAVPKAAGEKAFTVISENRYGFRGYDNSIGLTLIRSTYDPDPLPESGMNKFSFFVSQSATPANAELLTLSERFCHAMTFVSGRRRVGCMPPLGSFLRVTSGSVMVSAVKKPEDGGHLLVRVYELDGADGTAAIRFPAEVKCAWLADLNETARVGEVKVAKDEVTFDVRKNGVVNLCVELA